jgi:hypothetical protein
MATYFITPYKPTEWETAHSDLQIDPAEYKHQIITHWPETEFYTPSGRVSLEWGIPESKGGARIHGGLHDDRQVISLDTPFEKFFLWHRSVIPNQYKLFIFHESTWESLELTGDTTLEDIQKYVDGPHS